MRRHVQRPARPRRTRAATRGGLVSGQAGHRSAPLAGGVPDDLRWTDLDVRSPVLV